MKNAVKSFQVPSQYELIAFIAFNTIRNIVEIKLINKVFDAFSIPVRFKRFPGFKILDLVVVLGNDDNEYFSVIYCNIKPAAEALL